MKFKLDKQLAPRLKIIGYLLIFFSFLTATYSFFLPTEPSIATLYPSLGEEIDTSGLEFSVISGVKSEIVYLGAIAFLVTGVASIVFAKRKGRSTQSR